MFLIVISFPITAFAHSGRTDSQGGHRDNKNKSGLGSYHYHHGYPAHLHDGGVCPYSSGNTSSGNASSSNTGSQNNSSQSSLYTKPSPSISITNYPETLNVGDTSGIEYSISNVENDSCSLKSSDSNIIKVNSDNTLTAVGIGSAQITIKASGVEKTITIEVKPVMAEEIHITNKVDKIHLGDNFQYTVEILPINTSDKSITWSSSDNNIAEIIDGTIHVKSTGNVTLTVSTSNNISDSMTVEFFEILPESIVCEDTIDLTVGDNYRFKCDILPEDADDKNFTINIDNEELLQYSGSYLNALQEGKTILHVTTLNNIVKDIPVNIKEIPVESVTIIDSTNYIISNFMDISERLNLTGLVKPSNASYKDITWESSNSEIISIEDDVFITNKTGKVTIYCYASDGAKDSIDIVVINIKTILFSLCGVCIVCVFSILFILYLKKKKHSSNSG